MPDPPATPDAGPELPLRAGALVAEQGGIALGETHIPWDRVSLICWDGRRVRVHEFRPDGSSREALRARTPSDEADGLSRVWREVLLRRVERDGVLRGTVAHVQPRWVPHILIAAGVALAAYGVVAGLVAGASDLADARERMVAVLTWNTLLASVVVAAGVVQLVREKRLARRWSRWELSADGFAHFPAGLKEQLAFRPGDRLTLRGVSRVGGVRVHLGRLTGVTVLQPMIVALAERAGMTLSAGGSEIRVLIDEGRAMLERLGW